MFWNEKIETMPRAEMDALQGERLKTAVRRAYDNVPLYRKKMEEAGVTPDDIKSISDISRLPFTLKTDLRDAYPFGMFAVEMDQVIRIHASSGTTGKQTVVGYTQKDIDIWSESFARCLSWIGCDRKDIIHVSYGYGLFTGGLGAHYGGEFLGAATIPVSSGNTKRQIQIMRDFGSTVLCCTPSYAIYIAEALREEGLTPADISLKCGLFGAEPWTESMRQEIERGLGIKAYDIYGLSEITGPGVSNECECQNGLHVNEDHFVPEIIDPNTGEPLPDGVPGELVFTCITKEAMPLIRYRTRDISTLIHEKCACGRTLVRMSKPQGRSDDMLIIRGVNVFPSQIESVLLDIAEVAPYYLLIVNREDSLDTLEVQVELKQEYFSDEVRKLEEVEKKIKREIDSTLGVSAKIRLVGPKAIARSEGKAVRVIDNRKLYD